MKKWLNEPLVHFVVLGGLIFALWSWRSPGTPSADEIVVSVGQQKHLMTAFSRTWQRPPTQEEFNNLVDDWIREEIAYRQGIEMGLDSDDTIIRRRLRQKLELLAEDIVSMAEPDDAVLQQYLEDHQQNYMQEVQYTLNHVFFSPDRRGENVARDAEQALVLLATANPLVNFEEMGDPLPLPRRLHMERESALAAQFGTVFSQELSVIEPGQWQGPVRSGFGLHLVFVEEKVPGRALTLAETRGPVSRDWSNQQRVDTIDALYERMREQYSITVEPMNAPENSP